MMNALRRTCLVFTMMLTASLSAGAQQISGFSTVGVEHIPPIKPLPLTSSQSLSAPPFYSGDPAIDTYSDTEEDYVASLYYNVTSQSSLYVGGGMPAIRNVTYSGNPTANGNDIIRFPETGLYFEYTNHVLDFFYVASSGGYYDPYGFSIVSADPSGDYDSGWWFSVYVTATYVVEESVVLGGSFDTTNYNPGNFTGPMNFNVLYQAFIAPDYVYGPPSVSCVNNVYAGDNRGLNPQGGPFRGYQQIVLGVGGLPGNSGIVPTQGTGWTYQFSADTVQNGVIPPSAYNYGQLGQCKTNAINAYGHAPTDKMVLPPSLSTGPGNTGTHFTAAVVNPVPLWAFPIDWDATVNLGEPNPTTLEAKGHMQADCYPTHELSVGGQDVDSWIPTSDTTIYIGGCLAGASPYVHDYDTFIPLIMR